MLLIPRIKVRQAQRRTHKMGNSEMVERRSILKAAAVFGGLSTLAVIAPLFQGRASLGTAIREPIPLVAACLPRRTKPLIVVTHGDTWNMAHELFLVADIRVASADTRFGQDENTHGRFPGGGSTVRFVREAGWGNAMRYMLTGDHWNAEEAYRIG